MCGRQIMDGMPEPLYPEGSITRRVNRENVLLLGGGRALLMQLAHPKVAAGVDQHSDFRTRPIRRLRRTVRMTMAIVLGELLGIPRERFPATLAEFTTYLERMMSEGEVSVGSRARELGSLVLRPRLRLLPGPAMIPFEIVTTGLLPPVLRGQYGLAWGDAQRRLFRLLVIALPRLVAVTPPVLRVWPLPGHNVSLEPSIVL